MNSASPSAPPSSDPSSPHAPPAASQNPSSPLVTEPFAADSARTAGEAHTDHPAGEHRPFGAHLPMSWWRPLAILTATLIVMLVAQLLLSIVAIAVESIAFGRDPMSMEMTPLLMLAGNISLVAMAAASVLLTVLLARTSWRSIVAHGRSFSAGMMLRRLGLFAALVAVGMGAMMLVAPDMAGVSSFAVTGGTVGMLAVVLLTTPLQAAAEEITFRGTVMPAVASWIRGAQRAALIVDRKSVV